MSTRRPCGAVLTAVVGLLAASLGSGCSRTLELGPDTPRHVVFVSIDTLRADHVACYGHPFVQTPTLDGLAREGVRFSQCISTTSTTLASHTSLFTGTYPHSHGVVSNGHAVHPDNVMLPEILAEGGFRCAGFVGAVPLDTDVGFHQGFEHYDARISGKGRYGRHQRPANEVTDAALAWLDDQGPNGAPLRDHERLFLFVHYYDVHWPYTPPASYAGMYRDTTPDPDAPEMNLRKARKLLEGAAAEGPGRREPGFAARVVADAKVGAPLAHALEANYSAGVTWTDAELGRLLEGLQRRGILDEALVLVTSDHGETLHEHSNMLNHGASVYDTEIHVPLVLRFPDGRHAGTVVERLTSGIDVLPTLLSILDIPAPSDVEGEDVSGAVTGSLTERAPVFAEATKPTGEAFNDDPLWPNRGKFQCIRTERYKYMFRLTDTQFRLYDIAADPREERDLLIDGDEAQRDQADELGAQLRAWRDDVRPDRATGVVDSERQREGLEALGYGGDDD